MTKSDDTMGGNPAGEGPGADAGTYPVLPLRDIVVFPHMVVPLFVGREKSIRALEEVMRADKQILLVTQREAIAGPLAGDLIRAAIFEIPLIEFGDELLYLFGGDRHARDRPAAPEAA